MTDEQLALCAKAMGHPARVRIMRHLISQRRCVVGSIVEEIGLAQSTVSQHLKMLKEAGLIFGEVDGARVCYCVNPPVLTAWNESVALLAAAATACEGECECECDPSCPLSPDGA
ncbi:MAG: metalloregulator ArsR/SmtB family transcription factor [Candidatus Poribacteria bacterium]|nr:metalloregulator ArsR/SmtB family transcription factor [Candidatus Poribacteria bacterium]